MLLRCQNFTCCPLICAGDTVGIEPKTRTESAGNYALIIMGHDSKHFEND